MLKQDVQDAMISIHVVFKDLRLDIPKEYPEKIQEMMNACWRKEPTERPSFLILSSILSQHIDLTKEF